ncbi:putative restriction endonuclease [Saccharothrix tamanrassetensis]|uniref:Putative restriction endonuclease n=1 Tax=Saccharothrix tamanrassetensis TaxID=1051531 RepID=A0A841CIF8_9PSEU|nr:HNH endonuclease [Saccharothrix tamanrassetensis]MBB5955917.1 putative restriction endonuclease [Saccharothrix tamanrassetensis]
MGYADVRRQDVSAAIAEYDELGKDAFLAKYRYAEARQYLLVHGGRRYDSKAIVGVAHRHLTGTALTPDEFSGGRATVGRHLAALGFRVEGMAPPGRVFLQPRGLRDGGAAHFANTVVKGVVLAEHAEALGPDLAALEALYPDGVAKLWGNTAPKYGYHAKAKALAARRVGDHVLFHAEHAFVAEAVILHLFDNEQAAASIWGSDRQGRTFTHMAALGDVRLYDPPLDARPALNAAGLGTVRHFMQAPDAFRLESPARDSTVAKPRLFSAEDMLNRLITLDRDQPAERIRKRQALALLWTIGQRVAHRKRWHSEEDFRSGVGELLRDFDDDPGPEVVADLFWHLQNTDVWTVDLDNTDPLAGFDDECDRLLESVVVRTRAITALRSRHLNRIAEDEDLLARLGLEGYARASSRSKPAGDREAPVSRRQRSGDTAERIRSIAEEVTALYDDTCQFCGTRLLTGVGFHSEAAHIRGLGEPHRGPDHISNALCLCPNCHAQFDRFGIYVDDEGVVRLVHNSEEVGELRRHPDHDIDDAHVRYHRSLCHITPPA